jgi:hypothetical protein
MGAPLRLLQIVLAVLALGVGFLPAGAGAGNPAREPKAGSATPGEADRFTIAVIGDSLADGMWGGLYRLVQKDKRLAVQRGAKNSVGFTGGDLTDMIDRAFAAGGIDALLMMIGANDRRSFFIDGKAKALLRTPTWIGLYRGRVERFMDHAGKRNVPLVWILLPVMRAADATADAKLINDIVTEAAKGRSHVILIETWSLTADAKGQYLSHFNDLAGQKRLMRASDGVHLEQPAYELIGDQVMRRLREAAPRLKRLSGE